MGRGLSPGRQRLGQPRRTAGIDDSAVSIEDSCAGHSGERCEMVEAKPWTKVKNEQLSEVISRQMVSGEEATLARILLTRGAIVPRHHHRSEQYTMILSGALKFVFDDGETTVHAGETLLIPAHVPHAAEALEDTVDIDFFAPRREEWIRGDDAYLRRGVTKA
jgi:quercetin dioxygenase-like cupin family protein